MLEMRGEGTDNKTGWDDRIPFIFYVKQSPADIFNPTSDFDITNIRWGSIRF